ncbi:MAG: AI-2E family transporter [Lachnospiraceae bacterium]|nr:AI-2E family transporter [Lachnospiraceae bacterium]
MGKVSEKDKKRIDRTGFEEEPVRNENDRIIHPDDEKGSTAFGRVKEHWGSSQIFDFALWAFIVIAASIVFWFLLNKVKIIGDAVSTIVRILSPIIIGFALAYILNPAVAKIEAIILKWFDMRDLKREERRKNASKAEAEHEKEISERKAARIARKEAKKLAYEGDSANILDRRHRNARYASVAIVMTMTLALVILMFMAVIPALIDSMIMLANNIPSYYNQVEKLVMKTINGNSWLRRNVPDADTLFDTFDLDGKLEKLANELLDKAGTWILVAIRAVINIAIGLIVAIYLLAGKERYLGQLKKLSFSIMRPARAKSFVQTMNRSNVIFMKSLIGKMIDSVIIGFICYIVMVILGLFGMKAMGDTAVLVSVIVGVTNIIPYFGPLIGAVPGVILILCESLPQAIVFTVFIIILQQFDSNYLTPKIVGKSVGLSPFYVIVSCLLGGGLFGVLGMILGIPVGAIIYGFVKTSLELRLEERALPTQTKEYALKPGYVIYEEAAAVKAAGESDQEDES